jgi:hypothetical protein
MIDNRALEALNYAGNFFDADLASILVTSDLADEASGTGWDGLATTPEASKLWRDIMSSPVGDAPLSLAFTAATRPGDEAANDHAPALSAAPLAWATQELPQEPPRVPPSNSHNDDALALGYTRTLTNDMALRVLYIPLDMHSHLCLGDMYPKRAGGRRLRSSIVQLVLAKEARPFQVTMAQSSNCRHRRFTTGWRAFCRSADLRVGDALTFKRGRSANQLLVVVRKQQGGGDEENREPLVAGGCH